MRLSTNTLLIVANPFAAPLSAEGRCTALCPADPAEGGGRYVGARTVAKTKAQPTGMRSPFGPRDKVSVSYDLRPVKVADTSYYRNAIKARDVFVGIVFDPATVTSIIARVARASLAAFVADGGDRAQALAEWRKQGLAAIADAIDPPRPDKAGADIASGRSGSVEMKDLAQSFATFAGMTAPPSAEIQASDRTEGAVS